MDGLNGALSREQVGRGGRCQDPLSWQASYYRTHIVPYVFVYIERSKPPIHATEVCLDVHKCVSEASHSITSVPHPNTN